MSYVDSGTGKLVGINEDVLDWISQKTGLTFESKKIEEGTNPIDALKAVYKYRVPILAIAILVAACVTLFLVLIVNRQRSLGLSQERNVQLADALAQAQTASRAKGDFLARMSHEIRTPLNAVIGMSTLAHDHVDDPARIEDDLDKIDLSSQMLLSTINDVLDMSAIESDKIKIAHEPFDLDELILSLDTVYYAQCQQKGIDFDATSLVPPDEWFVGDQLRLSQVLNNLLSNAVKFTDEGGVTLSVLQTPISAERAYLEFKVSDTGCGMSPETLERLFQPFEQESAKTAQQHGGSGLGLAIAQNLVGLMHGDIQVTSTKGVGSTFVVTVPLETGTNAPRQAVDHDGRPDLSGRRALVVEDNETNRIVAVGLLGKANVTCDTAANGQEALDLFGSFEPGTYDVILMDLQMPIMDGYEATRAIRACGHPDARTVPIIAMTANAFSEDLSRALGCGMNDRIVKPIDPQRMFDTLASYLKRR
jgi:signal transduction histidine kinase